ncbi:DDHD-domain-containing protein [Piedraia hortae CBS 480.64]|uniref:DDHD-domain-containing protein n=1 Tax=Piedraia hortae CBS 480.64 TaxID=1314780 RepID=A0A6A7C7C8_9PEZI|nr:DDHD-domain-containing protein [Piedraia hortae CBS 480.64]
MPPSKGKGGEPEPLIQQQQGTDHVVGPRHRLSLRKYPKDCPLVRPRWFHAVDVPKRRPQLLVGEKREERPLAAPKKYTPFSVRDSKAIEAAFQKSLENDDDTSTRTSEQQSGDVGSQSLSKLSRNMIPSSGAGNVKVPVNEDYLFDVDVDARELAPTYWLGPIYEVRRGTWFYQEASTQRPCDENLAAQLEEGYLKLCPWRFPSAQQSRDSSRTRTQGSNIAGEKTKEPGRASSAGPSSKVSTGDLRGKAKDQTAVNPTGPDTSPPPNTHRLFGAHMNSVVTYQDDTTAWLLTDDFLSRMNYTVYQRFAGGGHFAGIKLTRGYVPTETKPAGEKDEAGEDKKGTEKDDSQSEEAAHRPSVSEVRRRSLQRQMSTLLETPAGQEDPEKEDEEARRRDEREIEDDYRETEGDEQGREIEHLILVTHGIGQRLGLRMESVNFVHDVNTFRKTIKAVYAESPDLRALNAELDNPKYVNSRLQVLPICWRHLLDFPKQSVKHNRQEADIADPNDPQMEDEENFPSLEDITVEGVPAVRNLITDLALDILLYQSPVYKNHMARIVASECNRIYSIFRERNPNFQGKVSMVGHSLGSAIMFEILCRQGRPPRPEDEGTHLNFEVEDFYALGSPIGLFQMLTGQKIVARQDDASKGAATDDPMLDVPVSARKGNISPFTDMGQSSPKCGQIFNIFHPTDPISYRLEPLISSAMASLKPQPLPYTKRGLFGAQMGQGLTGIGARVSQSVSSMWSSMASSLLTRRLGYNGPGPPPMAKSSGPLSMRLSPQVEAVRATDVKKDGPAGSDGKQEKLATDTLTAAHQGQHPPTLIEAELETLYSGFEKQRDKSEGSEASAEQRARKLKREEDKVRALNSNGRVDYAIQEGVFDINLIAAIASHLSYWGDEDVSHFIISQLLSRQRRIGGF